MTFGWENNGDLQIRDVRARVVADMAWVTMIGYDVRTGPYNITNMYEKHNDRWYMVHHHISPVLLQGLVMPLPLLL